MDPDARHANETSAELFDFLSVFLRDLERGGPRVLEDYLRRFPGCEEEIRREYDARRGPSGEAQPDEVRRVGPYDLLQELGRGGQGVVYLARDTRIERQVALKLLPASSLLFSEAKRGRLRREAEVVSRLQHPGICGIYDAEISGEFAYIAMPVIEGFTLAAAITAARDGVAHGAGATPALPLAPASRDELHRLLGFFEQCARSLHAAHEAGVVHRDVKPGNLMVTPDGRGVWLDFGQARDTQTASRALTQSGEVFGTPAYMSPEQVMGDVERVDVRTDVWAMGVSLFEALTLERPFQAASTHALLTAVTESPPLSACILRKNLPRDVDVVLRTALEKDITRRYASALEFAEELARIIRSEPILARPAGPFLRLRRWARRSPVMFVSISGALLALTLALLWTLYLLAREERALDYALGRHLGERSIALLDEDPSASLVLCIEAVQRGPSYLTRSALYAALERCYLAREFDGTPARRFRDIVVMEDGLHVAAALSDGTARLYELDSGKEVLRWQVHEGDAVTICSLGTQVATGGQDQSVVVYDTASGTVLLRIEDLDEVPSSLSLSAARDSDPPSLTIRTETGGLQRFALPSGLRLEGLPALDESTAGGLDLSGKALMKSVMPPSFDPGGGLVHATLSPDETRLATALEGGLVHLWNVADARRLASFEGYLNPVKVLWSRDGEYLVTHSKGPTARVWYATNRPDLFSLYCGPSPVEWTAFSGNGERAMTISADGTARIWSTPTQARRGSEIGALLAEVDGSESGTWMAEFDEFAKRLDTPLEARGALAVAVALAGVTSRCSSHDLERLATTHDDNHVRLWDRQTGALLWERKFTRANGEVVLPVGVAFHPGGGELAIACSDSRVRMVDSTTGSPSREDLRTIPPGSVHWSPDGLHLLVTGPKGRGAFHVQHLETGERMRTEVFHRADITCGSFSPDGALVLTSSLDGTIFVRDVRDGSPLVHLKGDGAPVLHAAFSPGPGQLRVIGAFADGSARVWPVDPLPGALARKPRELANWEVAREERLAWPLHYR